MYGLEMASGGDCPNDIINIICAWAELIAINIKCKINGTHNLLTAEILGDVAKYNKIMPNKAIEVDELTTGAQLIMRINIVSDIIKSEVLNDKSHPRKFVDMLLKFPGFGPSD